MTIFAAEPPRLPPDLCKVARAKCGPDSGFGTVELLGTFAGLEELDRRGLKLPGAVWSPEVASHKIDLLAAGDDAEHASDWFPVKVSLDKLAWLTAIPCTNVQKAARGIVAARVLGTKRRKEECVASTGALFDDDGVLGREKIEAALSRPDAPVAILYGTASDGKARDEFDVDSYVVFARAGAYPQIPTDESAAAYLNKACEFGPSYRDVRLVRGADGRPRLKRNSDGDFCFVASFKAQERTRIIVPWSRPLEGEVFARLKEDKLYSKFMRAVELDIFGVSGCDVKTFQPVAIGYLPSGNKPNFYHRTFGQKLFDPYPIAERILAEVPRREKKALVVGDKVSAREMSSLRGVLLASLLSEQYPELCSNTTTTPTVLKRCPFADEHSSKRGQSDRACFAYDPDVDAGRAYPVMRCHHTTCSGRKTEDFVGELIESGEVSRESIYQNSDYRIAIKSVKA